MVLDRFALTINYNLHGILAHSAQWIQPELVPTASVTAGPPPPVDGPGCAQSK